MDGTWGGVKDQTATGAANDQLATAAGGTTAAEEQNYQDYLAYCSQKGLTPASKDDFLSQTRGK